ncbi:PTS sugar transporter subunit IIA [Labrys wisconsinensis]|uniref:PTS system nitrogen regulatory IIA component n=1 Tax=Labrys wisconsinensis TaxID=425677 RepID=A0ABU0J9L0_9HYPH|nr:PTS sugar transporter subunit IIA [Labrys wisconsinensis]MDQ0470960.1 PTS system nitrogen regulatory IIA component [Labrys wisconsinensis]
MQIADFLAPASVHAAVRAADKTALLRILAGQAAGLVAIGEADILAALTARESLGSTGMGGGFALPHARLPGVARPTGVFAQLRTPIDFEAIDGKPVDLVFLLLLPTGQQTEQLQALACAARRLRGPELAARLRRLAAPAELFTALTAA